MCTVCKDKGFVPCPDCRGQGKTFRAHSPRLCRTCHGKAKSVCPRCAGIDEAWINARYSMGVSYLNSTEVYMQRVNGYYSSCDTCDPQDQCGSHNTPTASCAGTVYSNQWGAQTGSTYYPCPTTNAGAYYQTQWTGAATQAYYPSVASTTYANQHYVPVQNPDLIYRAFGGNKIKIMRRETENVWESWNNPALDNYRTIEVEESFIWDSMVKAYVISQESKQSRKDRAAAQQREAEAARIRVQEAEAKRTQMRLEAERKALALLKSALTEIQLERFMRNECIPVNGKAGKYLITKRGSVNIDVIEGTHVGKRLCASPQGLPIYDNMLAQKLHLEHNEEEFLSIANVHEGAL